MSNFMLMKTAFRLVLIVARSLRGISFLNRLGDNPE